MGPDPVALAALTAVEIAAADVHQRVEPPLCGAAGVAGLEVAGHLGGERDFDDLAAQRVAVASQVERTVQGPGHVQRPPFELFLVGGGAAVTIERVGARPEGRRATLSVVSSPVIRAPRIDELERCRDIERAAGVLFAEIGFAAVAADEPASAEVLADYVRDQRAWLITNAADEPVGYAVADIVDGLAHLEQLSVLPDQGRRGLGTALLEHVCTWARNDRREAVTLTTFVDVPWNAPFYARHGFRIMDEAEIGPELRDLRAHEAAHGLDPAQRVCMYRALE